MKKLAIIAIMGITLAGLAWFCSWLFGNSYDRALIYVMFGALLANISDTWILESKK